MYMRRRLLSSLILSFVFTWIQAQKSFLQCGYILDVHSGKYLKNKTIVVEGNKIGGIENGFTGNEQEGEIINLKDKYILPGFTDNF